MPTLEEIEAQIENRGWEMHINRGVIPLLPIILEKDEELKASETADFERKHGNFFATNKRLIHVISYSPGNSETESLWYSDISTVTTRTTRNMSEYRDIVFCSGAYHSAFTHMFKSSATKIMAILLEHTDLIESERNGVPYYSRVFEEAEVEMEAE